MTKRTVYVGGGSGVHSSGGPTSGWGALLGAVLLLCTPSPSLHPPTPQTGRKTFVPCGISQDN